MFSIKFPKFDQAEEDITEIPKLYQEDNDSEKKSLLMEMVLVFQGEE